VGRRINNGTPKTKMEIQPMGIEKATTFI